MEELTKTMQAEMKKQARALASVRQSIEERKETIENLHNELMQDERYQALVELQEGLSELNKRESAEKSALAELLVKAYQVSGEKTYAGMGQVKVRKVVTWEERAAVSYLIDAGMQQLLVPSKDFKKMAEGLAAVGMFDWVKEDTEPYAAVSSSLEV